MNQLEVSSSIISTNSLSEFIKIKYGLGERPICRLLKAGINHTYLVNTSDGKYVFRIYSFNWRTKGEILEEIRLLTSLKGHNVSISYPIPDPTDQYIQEIIAPEGNRHGVLFSYAEGEKLQTYSAEHHYKVGVLMGRIHTIAEGLTLKRVDYTPAYLLVESLEKISHFLQKDTPEFKFLANTQSYLLEELRDAKGRDIHYGVVHMDIWFDNLNITKEGEITIFDFDFCGNGMLGSDIAYYLLQLIHLERDEAERQLKTEQFFAGYETIRTISKRERDLLPILGMCSYYFYLGVQCDRYENWSNVFLNETYLKRYINVIIKGYFTITGLDKKIVNNAY